MTLRLPPAFWKIDAVSFVLLLVLSLAATPKVSAQIPAWLDPARILVVANTAMADTNGNGIGDSMEVAQRYAALRGVPSSNLLLLPLSNSGTSFASWATFWNELRTPLAGRVQALGATNILTILLCHGVPYEVSTATHGVRSVDQALMTPNALGSVTTPAFVSYWQANPFFDAQPGVAPDYAHFQHQVFYAGQHMYLVSRLDGPTPEEALDLVEGARYGDLYLHTASAGYGGRIYVDTRFSTYPNPAALPWPQFHAPSYANADSDMAYATQWMTGFPLWWENTSSDLEIGQLGATYANGSSALTAPDAMFYYGWYNYATYHNVWTWLPGSAACDLNSNSLAGVRSTNPGTFGGSSFRRGLTCGVGCIAEPYLNGHHFPEIFIKSLLDGRTFAESAAISDPSLLWRSIAVGDPLYCPLPPGKVLVIDTVAPPVPSTQLALTGGSVGSLRVAVDTLGRAADPVRLEGFYGVAPRLDQALVGGSGHRAVHFATLTALVPGAFYRWQPAVCDPAGLVTSSVELLAFNSVGNTVQVAAQADSAAASAGLPWNVEFALKLPNGLGAIQWLGLEVDAPAYGVLGADLLLMLPYLPLVLHSGGNCWSLEVTIPQGLPAGLWTLRIELLTTGGLVQSAVSVNIP
ncbi:MAG: TIGR03790 family protein [Planctomycetes bacterium]|nr:TIGR03790 family protein [Planctomycetota bacterium]